MRLLRMRIPLVNQGEWYTVHGTGTHNNHLSVLYCMIYRVQDRGLRLCSASYESASELRCSYESNVSVQPSRTTFNGSVFNYCLCCR